MVFLAGPHKRNVFEFIKFNLMCPFVHLGSVKSISLDQKGKSSVIFFQRYYLGSPHAKKKKIMSKTLQRKNKETRLPGAVPQSLFLLLNVFGCIFF